MWPFRKKIETRSSWADAVAQLEHLIAGSADVSASRSAAAETAAGLLERSLRLSKVTGVSSEFSREISKILPMAARELILTGESLFLIEVRSGLRLIPAVNNNITGKSTNPLDWNYTINLNCPSSTIQQKCTGESVVHFRQNCRAREPWIGRPAWANAADSGTGVMRAERSLSSELDSPVGNIIPSPLRPDMESSELEALSAAIKALRGRPLLVESMAGGFGNTLRTDTRQSSDWMIKRLGPNLPDSSISALGTFETLTALSVGLPAELIRSDASSSAKREAWRQCFHSFIMPMARLMETELSEKLETPDVRIDLRELAASDLQGRARSFAALTKPDNRLKLSDAAEICGLL